MSPQAKHSQALRRLSAEIRELAILHAQLADACQTAGDQLIHLEAATQLEIQANEAELQAVAEEVAHGRQ